MKYSITILICLFCVTSTLSKNIALQPHIMMPDLSKLSYVEINNPKGSAAVMNSAGLPFKPPKFDVKELHYATLLDDTNK